MMRPLVLVPCSSSKTLAPQPGLRGRDLAKIDIHNWSQIWLDSVAQVDVRVQVEALYKGGGWAIAKKIHYKVGELGGSVGVVSAGLGLVTFSETAPGYDITFTPGSVDSVPGSCTPEARSAWWSDLGGREKLMQLVKVVQPTVILTALPSAYLDAVALTLAELSTMSDSMSICVLTSGASSFAQAHLSEALVQVNARKALDLGGSVGQILLSTARFVVEHMTNEYNLGRSDIQQLIQQLPSRCGPLYPARARQGADHLRMWLRAVCNSDNPPRSASDALRRYRDGGYAYAYKAFHNEYSLQNSLESGK